jgi:arginyl-tRNA synthetase
MILNLQHKISHAVADAVSRRYGLADLPPFTIEAPPTRALGDFAVTAAFQLARTLRKPPRAIAAELATDLAKVPGVAHVAAAPNGYLNLYLDRRTFLLDRLVRSRAAELERTRTVDDEKTIVEHTAINPNKAAHIGHLRNAALGDMLVRVLRFRQTPVEVQNYIDDTGVQVADVVIGFRELEHRTPAEVREIADTTRFDYCCWDLYARVTEWYEADRTRLALREATLHDIEKSGTESAAIGALVADRIVRCHLKTMERLNIGYDLLSWEGDILRLHFWSHAFETLKSQGAVFLQTAGRLAGCWVMRIESAGGEIDGSAEGGEEDPREKVIVRSNGTVTYVGKDMAYQLWKFGLLGRDFRYRLFGSQATGGPLWSTTSGETDPAAPAFGNARRIYNVIDSRQSYLQDLLRQALRALGHPEQAERSVHFSYEMVALTQDTARELGYEIAAEDAQKPFVEVSGRKGLGVKIDDLLDLLTEKAAAEVAKRNPEFTSDECRRAATQIAVAAIRYFMVKYSRGKLIAFDIGEALNFEGESGPYLQYAVVRANNIFRKLQEREGVSEADVIGALDRAAVDELGAVPVDPVPPKAATIPAAGGQDDLWALVFEAARLDEVVEQVVRSLEFSILAKYAFGLAQRFNAFYHRYPILNEGEPDRKYWRAAAVHYFRTQLTRALDLMGVEVPSRM